MPSIETRTENEHKDALPPYNVARQDEQGLALSYAFSLPVEEEECKTTSEEYKGPRCLHDESKPTALETLRSRQEIFRAESRLRKKKQIQSIPFYDIQIDEGRTNLSWTAQELISSWSKISASHDENAIHSSVHHDENAARSNERDEKKVSEMDTPIQYYNAGLWTMKGVEAADEVKKIRAEIEAKNKNIDDGIKKIKQLELKVGSLEQSSKKELGQLEKKFKKQIDAKNDHISVLENKAEEFKKDAKVSKNSDEKIQKLVKDSVEREEKFKKQIDDKNDHISVLENKAEEFKKDAKIKSTDVQLLSKKSDEKIQKLVKDLEVSTRGLKDQSAKQAVQQDHANNNDKKLSERDSQVEALEKKLNSIEIALKEKACKADKYERERDTVKEQLNEITASNKTKGKELENQLALLGNNLKEKGSALDETLKERDIVIQQSQESSRSLNVRMEELQKQVESHKSSLKEKILEVDKISEERATLNRKVDKGSNLENQISSLQKQLESHKSSLKEKTLEVDNISEERATLKKKVDEALESKNEELNASKSKIQSLENQLTQVQPQVNEKVASNGDWGNGAIKVKLANIAKNALQDELNSARSQIDTLTAEKKALKEQLAGAGTKTCDITDIADSEDKFVALEEENSQLTGYVAKSKGDVDESKDVKSFAAMAERAQTQDDFARRKREVTKSNNRIKELESQVESMMSDMKKNQMLEDSIKKKSVEDARKRREEDHKRTMELEITKADNHEVKRQVLELQDELNEVILQNQQASKDAQNHREERALVESRIPELEEKIRDQKAKLKELKQSSKTPEAPNSTNGIEPSEKKSAKAKKKSKKKNKKFTAEVIKEEVEEKEIYMERAIPTPSMVKVNDRSLVFGERKRGQGSFVFASALVASLMVLLIAPLLICGPTHDSGSATYPICSLFGSIPMDSNEKPVDVFPDGKQADTFPNEKTVDIFPDKKSAEL